MATQQFVKMPILSRQTGNMNTQRNPIPCDQTNVFNIGALVKIVSGEVEIAVTADTAIWGQAPGASVITGSKPPVTLVNDCYAFDLSNGAELIMNVGAISGGALVIGGSAKTTADVDVGASYGIAVPTSGAYAGIAVVDPTNTSQKMFTIMKKIDDSSYYNGQVLVRVLEAALQ